MYPNPAKSTPDYSEWPTKEQVAAILDVSTKTVEKLCAERKLPQPILWRRPSGGPKIAIYHPVDVEAVRRKMYPNKQSTFVIPAPAGVGSDSMNSLPSQMPQKSENGSSLTAEAAQLLQVFGLLSQKVLEASPKSKKPDVPIAQRVELSVREAAAYRGRPEKWIRMRIKDGSLPADREGHTRIRRADLDKL